MQKKFTQQNRRGLNRPILRPLWLMTSAAADVISVPGVLWPGDRRQVLVMVLTIHTWGGLSWISEMAAMFVKNFHSVHTIASSIIIYLTPSGLVKPHGVIQLGQHWFGNGMAPNRTQAITWTDTDLLAVNTKWGA